MSPVEFASAIQTSVSSVYRWEASPGEAKVDHVHTAIMQAIEQAIRDLPGRQRSVIAHNLRLGLRGLVYNALISR